MNSELDARLKSIDYSVELLNVENFDLLSAVKVVKCLSDDGFHKELIQKGCVSKICNILLRIDNDDLIGNALEVLFSLSCGCSSAQV